MSDVLIEFHQQLEKQTSFQSRVLMVDDFEEYKEEIKRKEHILYPRATLTGYSLPRDVEKVWVLEESHNNLVYEQDDGHIATRNFVYKLESNQVCMLSKIAMEHNK